MSFSTRLLLEVLGLVLSSACVTDWKTSALHQIIYRLIIQGVSLLKIKSEVKEKIKKRLDFIVDVKQSILKFGCEV